ncbi:hypothetical protein FRC00_003027 [Tulasnella sp. 408]|nr:hypothetical protein FRC00_003027 [Tulasnella sp. 408]
MAEISRSVAKKVQAFETSEGAGATVRRSIGSMNLHRLDPFLPDHPHRGQATVTYMFEGSVQHEDSAGHKGTIGPGDLQWMIAVGTLKYVGFGEISNDKRCPGREKELWIDLPKADKMTAPSYQELVSSQVPTAYPLGPDGPAEVKVISGQSFGEESPVRHLGGCWYLDIKLKAGGDAKAEFFQDIPIEGALRVNGQSIEKHYTVVLSAEENEAGILLSLDGDQDARAVLV